MRSSGGKWARVVALCIGALSWITPAAVRAADVVVTKTADTNDGTCNSDCSLREAVAAANPADTVLIPAGFFTLTMGEIDIDKGLTLQGAGANYTIIQAAEAPGTAGHRIFDVSATDSDLALLDLTLRHGAIAGTSGSGGAISWESGTGSLAITRCRVTLNQVDVSGPNNGGAASGGAIFFTSSGALTFTDSAVTDNQIIAKGGTGFGGAAAGGAIFGGASFLRSTLARNRIEEGGAMGGGAASGGAIFASSLILTDSTVSNNEILNPGASSGGAIFATDATVSSSTIADNRILKDGMVLSAFYVGNLSARNSIFARDGGCVTLDTSDGYNLVDVGCGFTLGPGDKVGTVGAPIEPGIGPLANNGGPTETRALLFGPAIDMGDPAGCKDETGAPILTDQRGLPRTVDGDKDGTAVCDIGAYELQFALGAQAPTLNWLGLFLLAAGLAGLGLWRLARPIGS